MEGLFPQSQLQGSPFPLGATQHPSLDWLKSKYAPYCIHLHPCPQVVTPMAHPTVSVPGHGVNATPDFSTLFLSRLPLCMGDKCGTLPPALGLPHPWAHPGPATWLMNNRGKMNGWRLYQPASNKDFFF